MDSCSLGVEMKRICMGRKFILVGREGGREGSLVVQEIRFLHDNNYVSHVTVK